MVPANGFLPRDRAERLGIAKFLVQGIGNPTDADHFVRACSALLRPGDVPAGAAPVTILICTYNRLHLLPEAVASARRQDWPVRIIVVNDGSTDGTADWLAAQSDITVLTHAPNRGKPAALDTGIDAIATETFLVLDDDDKLFPGSIRVLSQALAETPTAVAAWGDTIVFDGATGEPSDWRLATRLSMTKRAVLATIPALPGATLIRTAAQREVGKFDPRLVRGQDMDHFLRLSDRGPIVTVPLPVLLYRRHDGLRGDATARWRKHADPAEHRRRFLACVQPVFLERWARSSHDRSEGFAWVLGLAERDLPECARRELSKWEAPYTPHEAWVAKRIGSPSGSASTDPTSEAFVRLLVVDDGDDGALETTLCTHVSSMPTEVVLPAPRDTIGSAQIFWPGTYRVSSAFRAKGLVRVCLSSCPEWISPVVDAEMFPLLPPAAAVRALGWAMGWNIPDSTRDVRGSIVHPTVRACRDAATRTGSAALAPAIAVMTALPDWAPGILLAAKACEGAGLADDAAALRRRVSATEPRPDACDAGAGA